MTAVQFLTRKFDPTQPRRPDGEWGGGGFSDALKLAGKIDLEPDEKLLGSAKVDGDIGGIRMALTEQGGHRTLRLGLGSEGYGQRNLDAGTPAWDGNPPRAALPEAERERLSAEHDSLSEEYDTAPPARQAEISARQGQIVEQLAAGDEELNGMTAKLDEPGVAHLANALRPALAQAVAKHKAESAAWDEIEALQAKGNPDPARMAVLRQLARADSTDDLTFAEGVVPGSAWGDVHFAVGMSDSDPYVQLGVQPKGAPADWGAGRDWQGQFDPPETRKFLRLLDKYTDPGTASSRSADLQEALVSTRSFQPDAHPKAPPGSPTGGQFIGAAKKKSPPSHKPAPGPHGTGHVGSGTMSFDPKTGKGTGYDSPGGNPGVHDLQGALNRLGVTDSAGKPLAKDGKLGPKTTSAVKAAQARLGLPQDGKVTPDLLTKLKNLKSLPAHRGLVVPDLSARGITSGSERRTFAAEFEVRAAPDGTGGSTYSLAGYASVYDRPYRMVDSLGEYHEQIRSGAGRKTLSEHPDVVMVLNHAGMPLARTKNGSLLLSEDSTGLHSVAPRLNGSRDVVREVLSAVEEGILDEMSFGFRCVKQAWNTDYSERDISEYNLNRGDVSVVTFGANPNTSVALRAQDLDGLDDATARIVLERLQRRFAPAPQDKLRLAKALAQLQG